MFGSSRVMFNKKACFYWAQKIIHWVFAAVHGAAGGFNLLIYFFPEGSVTSAPPTQTSQALLAAGGTEQDSLVEQGKKKKKNCEATDGGVERMRGDTVCGQHLFIIDCCVELRGRDVHMTAWGNVLDTPSSVRADKHSVVFLLRRQVSSIEQRLKVNWEVV